MSRKTMRLLLCFFAGMWSTVAFSQGKNPVTGEIKDNSGHPVIGATIRVVGTKAGVATDESGKFSILAAAADHLVITSVGFETKEIKIGNQTSISVRLNTAPSS